MKWFFKRMGEQSSQLAVAGAVAAVAGVASHQLDWNTAALVLMQAVAHFIAPSGEASSNAAGGANG